MILWYRHNLYNSVLYQFVYSRVYTVVVGGGGRSGGTRVVHLGIYIRKREHFFHRQ